MNHDHLLPLLLDKEEKQIHTISQEEINKWCNDWNSLGIAPKF
jgi:hypothetical protein